MSKWDFLLDAVDSSWRAGGRPARVLAAVSGGADSVALLWVLNRLQKRQRFGLFAVHVDHGLRPESGEDAAFVAALCREWGLPCRIARVQVAGKGEDAAREARYAALAEACAQSGAQALALAHHQRDQAETLLLHLCRGSGTAGLCGMRQWAERPFPDGTALRLWRPLLHETPETLRALLMEQGVSWREDQTNSQDAYLRNFLRHRVLPVLAERIPGAEAAMDRAALVLQGEDDCLAQLCRDFLAAHACLRPPCIFLMRLPFLALHPALQQRVLRAASPVALDYDATLRALALSPGQGVNLPEGWRLLCRKERLHFVPPSPVPATPGRLTETPYAGWPGDGKRCQAFPKAALAGAQLRFRLPGDRIHPLGCMGEKSLQDYLVDRGVDQPFRDYVPLLCVGRRVIWAIGVGPGEEARVTAGTDARLLRYDGFLPGEIPGE